MESKKFIHNESQGSSWAMNYVWVMGISILEIMSTNESDNDWWFVYASTSALFLS
jgi:hypothetical protein